MYPRTLEMVRYILSYDIPPSTEIGAPLPSQFEHSFVAGAFPIFLNHSAKVTVVIPNETRRTPTVCPDEYRVPKNIVPRRRLDINELDRNTMCTGCDISKSKALLLMTDSVKNTAVIKK
jgi:hypothetical protein